MSVLEDGWEPFPVSEWYSGREPKRHELKNSLREANRTIEDARNRIRELRRVLRTAELLFPGVVAQAESRLAYEKLMEKHFNGMWGNYS